MLKFNDLADLEILKECLAETDLVVEDTVVNRDGEDKEIICKSCGKTFTFTVGEQEFYKSKNFAFPQRCRQCAKKRRRKFLNYR